MQTILLVDPETDFLEWAQNQLETPTTRVLTATTADEGYKIYISENPDLMVSETHLLPFSGLELLARIRQRDTNAMVILMDDSIRHRIDEAGSVRLSAQGVVAIQSEAGS
jgi:DNA-binding response OmpR family regulator